MGHGLLHQSNASGRIGAIFARSKDFHGRGEKVGVVGSDAARGSPESSSKFAIVRDSARYPSGPRERSAKPPFVGSNPTRASKIHNLGTFGTTGKRASSRLSIARRCVSGIAWV